MKAFVVFLAFICPFLVADELGACSMCTMAVDLLEQQVSKVTDSKENWMKKLQTISDEVCATVPQTFATTSQCKSFIELNADYIVDLLLSESKSESVCKLIGICNEIDDSTNYKLIFPTITEQQITYLVEEKGIAGDSTFNYKLFLGHPRFLLNTYQLVIQLTQIGGCNVNLKVTNKTNFVESDSCNSEKNCSMNIPYPGRGVWYYLTVHAKASGDNGTFVLNATENSVLHKYVLLPGYAKPMDFRVHQFVLILCLTFSAVCLLCLCISRCMFKKRAERRHKNQQQQVYAPIIMQSPHDTIIPIQDIEMFPPSEGYVLGTPSVVTIVYAPQPLAH